MARREEARSRRTAIGGGKASDHRRLVYRVAHSAGLLVAITLLWNPATAAGSALGKLRKGEAVEVSGRWSRGDGIFVATKMVKLPQGRSPSARGAIDTLDQSATRFRLFGRDIQVDQATVFAADSGATRGRFDDLVAGMRVDVDADAGPTETWRATKVVWRGLKTSDKVKGTITAVGPLADLAQTIQISGLAVRVTEGTDLETDYLMEELLGTLFSDEGDANAPNLQLGRVRLAGYGRVSTYSDDGYSLSGVDDDSLFAQSALAFQAAGDWASSFQTLVDVRLENERIWGGQLNFTDPRLEMLQGYGILRIRRERGAALVVGKQRVRDQREWLFDEYLDAVRLYLTVTRPLVLEASYLPSVFRRPGESFDTWNDLLVRARFIPNSRNEANVYWLMRRDSSPRRRQPIYLGLSCSGRPSPWLRGWLEAAFLRGEDKGRPQRAYALDFGATFTTTGRVRPTLTLSYAVGSGEEKLSGDPFSQEFRQTGYEDNTGRFGGISSFKYYGEVLDPELSNLEVMTAAAGVRFGYSASVDVVAHAYQQQIPDDDLRTALLLQGAPNGKSRNLGSEVDIILGVANILRCAGVAYGFGLFMPGRALEATDRHATRHRVSLRVAF
jgi:alginate export protein/uncharacterized protein DUF5666